MQNSDLARSLIKASIPFADQARRLKRRFVPYEPDPVHNGFTLEDGLEMFAALRRQGAPLDGDVLEVGSGWTPTIPLMFHVAGARSVTLTDLERLFDETSIPTATAFLGPRLDRLAAVLGRQEAALRLRFEHFRPAYLCPWNPDGHPAGTVDIAMSRACLEHVPAADVGGLFAALRRVVRPGGVMCHSIDNTDHFQHGNGKGSLIDFLRYPSDSLRWRLSQVNTQGRTNRLRHSDYLALARQAGWRIMEDRRRVPEQTLAEVLEMRRSGELAPEFRDRDPEDLAATATLLVARRED